MSRKNDQRDRAVKASPESATRLVVETDITVSGTLFNGNVKSQNFHIKHFKDQSFGEVVWNALQIVQKIGGLTEDVEDGIMFYPIDIFDGGLKFTEKK